MNTEEDHQITTYHLIEIESWKNKKWIPLIILVI